MVHDSTRIALPPLVTGPARAVGLKSSPGPGPPWTHGTELTFRGELHDQCLAAHRAYLKIQWAILQHSKPSVERQPPINDPGLDAVVHDSVCTFLDACAIVSKLLNPAPAQRDPERAARAIARGDTTGRSLGWSRTKSSCRATCGTP